MLRVLKEEEKKEGENETPIAQGTRAINQRQHSLFGSHQRRNAISI